MKITGKELARQIGISLLPIDGVVSFYVSIDKEYEINEPTYVIPLPNLKTSDGYQQYLSRKKSGGTWFASRDNEDVQQLFTSNELKQVPEIYRQYAKRVDE